MNRIGGNIKNAGEVFVMTDDIKEKQDIYDLNDKTARNNIRELISTSSKLTKEDKPIQWSDLSFVKRDLQKQLTELQNRK